MKKSKLWMAVAVIVIIGAFVLSFVKGKVEYFYGIALDPQVPKTEVFASDINAPSADVPVIDMKSKIEWLEKNSEINAIASFDGIPLKAYIAKTPEKSDKWVVVVHGYSQEPLQMAPNAYEFYNRGFNVLLPNLRGHGLSGGNYIGMGWNDRKDVIAWVEGIVKENPNAQIALYGISMGAATVMMVSGEKLPENVKCIIEDCGYTSAWDEFAYQLKSIYGLPSFPMMNLVNILVKKRAGYDLKEASALEQVKKCVTPMMFIHGGKDTFVPFYMMDELYNAAPCEKEKMTVANAGHGESYKVAPMLYWQNVFTFVEKYIDK